MSLTARVGLACSIAVSSDGTELNFQDTTGNFPTVSTGYGLTGGITSANVTQFLLELTWQSVDVSILYTFTVSSNVITAATVTDTGGTVYNIFSQLTSTTFPFVSANQFNLVTAWTNTGLTLPDFDDEVYTLDYTISGTGSGSAFAYTASAHDMRTFDTCCCITKLGLSVDPDCGCSEDKLWNYLRGDAYLSLAGFSADTGKDDNAVTFLNKAKAICTDTNCGCDDN